MWANAGEGSIKEWRSKRDVTVMWVQKATSAQVPLDSAIRDHRSLGSGILAAKATTLRSTAAPFGLHTWPAL